MLPFVFLAVNYAAFRALFPVRSQGFVASLRLPQGAQQHRDLPELPPPPSLSSLMMPLAPAPQAGQQSSPVPSLHLSYFTLRPWETSASDVSVFVFN